MLLHHFVLVRRLIKDHKGVTALEYGVIAAAIIVAIATVVGTLGRTLSTTFTNISHAV